MSNADLMLTRAVVPVLAVVLGLCPVAARASEEALALLQRMDQAVREQTYRGVFLFAHGGDLATLRVLHQGRGAGEEQEKITGMDGVARQVLRKGDRLSCMQPDTVDSGDACAHASPFARAFVHDAALMARNYQVSSAEPGRVAGREAEQLLIRPYDAHRHGYRLWVDRQTSMLLMCLMESADGQVLERFQFTQLEFPDRIPGEQFRFDGEGSVVERELPDESAPDALPDLGWDVYWLPDGFVAAHGLAARSGHLGARVYTDGLALLSVFVDGPDAGMMEGVSRMGASIAVTRRLSNGAAAPLVTVAGELPEHTVQQVAQSVRMDVQ